MSLSELFPQQSLPTVASLLLQPVIPSVPQNIFCVAGDEVRLLRRSRTWEGS